MSASNVEGLAETAKSELKSGNTLSALRTFQLLAQYGKDVYWYYFHIGECYRRLRAYSVAMHYFDIASNNLKHYAIEIEILKCYWSNGDIARFIDVFTKNVADQNFVKLAFSLVCSLPDFKISCQIWVANRNEIESALPSNDAWLSFFQRNHAILERHANQLKDSRSTISFSDKFVDFLQILSPIELQRLLTGETGAHTHFQFASWNLGALLQDGSVFDALPFWLLKRAANEQLNFVFDASREAPKFTIAQVQHFRRAALGASDRHRMFILTANADHKNASNTSVNIFTIEYNSSIFISAQDRNCNLLETEATRHSTLYCTLMLGVLRPHRIALMILLERAGLIDRIDYYLLGEFNLKTQRGLSYLQSTQSSFSELDLQYSEFEWLASLSQRQVDALELKAQALSESISIECLQRCQFNIVCETDFLDTNTFRLTEKVLKPIIAGVPFVVVGVRGLVTHLLDVGFDLIDDIIDHSYDFIEEPSARLQAIVAELKRLSNVTIDDTRLASMISHNKKTLEAWSASTKDRYVGALFQSLFSVRGDDGDLQIRTFKCRGRTFRFAVNNQRDVIQKYHYEGNFYESEELAIISNNFRNGGVYVDIGSNVGNHLVYVSKFLNPSKVVPIECSPDALILLRKNITLNCLDDVVDMSSLGYAAGAGAGFASMVMPQTNNLGAGRVRLSGGGEIPVLSGDQLLAHLDRIDFIKIDVEGKEIEVLSGLRETLAKQRPNLFIEVELNHVDEVVRILSELNYKKIDEYQRYRALTNLMMVCDKAGDVIQPFRAGKAG